MTEIVRKHPHPKQVPKLHPQPSPQKPKELAQPFTKTQSN